MFRPIFVLVPILLSSVAARSQSLASEKPLPGIPTLMRQVEANQRTAESLEQHYLFDQSTVFDTLDSHNGVKKTESRDFEIFWLNGVRVARLLKKNGKPLTPGELKEENDRIDKIVAKARERREKADAAGVETDSHGVNEITVSRILELGTFSNPRREIVDGRPTIVVDYLGDPHAKTRNAAEGAFKELAGTVWIDEADHALQHLEGHFDHDLKIMGGLAAEVKQGAWFKATFAKINNEVWLPTSVEANGHARYLLFFTLSGHLQLHTSGYRKFKATSTVLPFQPPTPTNPPPPE